MKASRLTWPGRSGPDVAGGFGKSTAGRETRIHRSKAAGFEHPVCGAPLRGTFVVSRPFPGTRHRFLAFTHKPAPTAGAGRNNHAGPTFLDHSREPPESTRDTGFIAFARIRKRPRASVPVHVAFV
ncbi:hypothetical protein GW17_00021314, partial [Ensete ventricosum]